MQAAVSSTHYEVRCTDGIVLLDLAADSYSCRYDAAPDPEPAGEPARPRWRDGPRPSDLPLHAWDVMCFVRAYAGALVSFPRRPLRKLLLQDSAGAMPSRADRLGASAASRFGKQSSLIASAARFERMSLYLPFRAPCLLKAFVLRRYLRLNGHDADWIVGVQLFPFRAHCWLAVGDLLIGERAHLIEDYVPIVRHSRVQL